jgi:hypothetical protein
MRARRRFIQLQQDVLDGFVHGELRGGALCEVQLWRRQYRPELLLRLGTFERCRRTPP